jgi:hypothetical protein
MATIFNCSFCNARLSTTNQTPGATVKCPLCGAKTQIPSRHLGPPPTPPVAHVVDDAFGFLASESYREPTDASRPKTRSWLWVPVAICFFGVIVATIVANSTPAGPGGEPSGLAAWVSSAFQNFGNGLPHPSAVVGGLGLSLSPEQEIVKRYILRNSLQPDGIKFDKWFPVKATSSKDTNAFERKIREDPKVRARISQLEDLIRSVPYPVVPQGPAMATGMIAGTDVIILADGRRIERAEHNRLKDNYEQAMLTFRVASDECQQLVDTYKRECYQLGERLYVGYQDQTADLVLRVTLRTTLPIVGTVRTENFCYLKKGEVKKCVSGTPMDVDNLIKMYYPGED